MRVALERRLVRLVGVDKILEPLQLASTQHVRRWRVNRMTDDDVVIELVEPPASLGASV